MTLAACFSDNFIRIITSSSLLLRRRGTMDKVHAKVVLLGRSGVGKSCLVERILLGSFLSNSTAVHPSHYFRYKLNIQDCWLCLHRKTNFCERNGSPSRHLGLLYLSDIFPYCTGYCWCGAFWKYDEDLLSWCSGCMCLLWLRVPRRSFSLTDVTSADSFQRARFWVNELLSNVETCKIYLVGCKGISIDDLFPIHVQSIWSTLGRKSVRFLIATLHLSLAASMLSTSKRVLKPARGYFMWPILIF